MYQQVALDHFNNGDGSCRGNTFLSGVFVLEDDAEKSLYNRFMEAGSYRRPSTHEVNEPATCTAPLYDAQKSAVC